VIMQFSLRQAGFYDYVRDVDEIPLYSHPISCQRIGERFWTHRPMSLAPTEEHEAPPPGVVLHNTLNAESDAPIVSGSDGSVHFQEQVAAAAWIVSTDEDHHMGACFLMSDVNRVSAYRSELEGIFRTLSHLDYLNITPKEVTHWCDNERSVIKCQEEPWSAQDMIAPDADLILAIHHLKSQLNYPTVFRHVYGHQDSKKPKKGGAGKPVNPFLDQPSAEEDGQDSHSESEASQDSTCTIDIAEQSVIDLFHLRPQLMPETPEQRLPGGALRTEAKINIACDAIASGVTASVLEGTAEPQQPLLQLPYRGSRAMFKIGGRWVTSHLKHEIYKARRTKAMRTYCRKRYKWDDETFDLVNWDSVRMVRSQLTETKKMQTSKIMHGWLPIMHMRQFITGISQCPGCACPDETMTHLFRCPHERMKATRREALSKLERLLRKGKVPQEVVFAIIHLMRTESDGGTDFYLRRFSPAIATALEDQERIGVHLMLRGFLAKSWADAMRDCGVTRNVDRRMNKLQRMMWTEWVEPIWKTRCDILYGGKNEYDAVREAELSAEILWYIHHRDDVLAYPDRFLAEIDTFSLPRMHTKTKKKWLYHLRKLKAAYDRERGQVARGQNVMEKYFPRRQPDSEAVT